MATPLFDCSPHFLAPSGKLGFWLTDPPGLAVQMLEPMSVTSADLDVLINKVWPALRAKWPGDSKFAFLYDLSVAENIETEGGFSSRSTNWALELRGKVSALAINLSARPSPMLKMATNVAAYVLKAGGLPTKVSFGAPSREWVAGFNLQLAKAVASL
ncbi:MAG: hypothetical protein QM765_26640 [Myxococcales bacterium]